jgi:hypothetical protein
MATKEKGVGTNFDGIEVISSFKLRCGSYRICEKNKYNSTQACYICYFIHTYILEARLSHTTTY